MYNFVKKERNGKCAIFLPYFPDFLVLTFFFWARASSYTLVGLLVIVAVHIKEIIREIELVYL